MTKLGAQPGVHGGEDVEKEAIKIDPKVFTVLQPTIIPMPAAPAKPTASFNAMRACFHCLFFATCLLIVSLLGFYFLAATPEIFKKIDQQPQMEALISSKPVDGSSEKDNGIVAIPLARVVVVEDISNNDGQKKTVVDGSVEEKATSNLDTINRPLHPDEIEQYRMMEARQQYQRMMEEQAYMQQMMAMRMWRMRRLQAAYYQQQQMKMAYFQQQQQQQEEAARQQWAERARYEEEQQQQRRQWEAQQAFAQQQRAAHAFWQQHQMEMQQQAQMIQQQQQQQPQFWQRPRPAVWQQPPQQFFFPQQQQHQQQSQEQQQQQMPEVPSFFQPAPQPSVHDRIYEELQKKSQNIPVNAPTRQIWTAITPTPAPEEPSTEAPVNTAVFTTTQSAADVSDTILRDIFSAFDEQKNSEAAKELSSSTTTEKPELEGEGAIVIEDSFPRIEERTTTPEPIDSDEEIETSSTSADHEKELDPFAAVLKFFENNPPRNVISSVSADASTTEKPILV